MRTTRPEPTFAQTKPGEGSWALWADRVDGVDLTGGYARAGATTGEIAAMGSYRMQTDGYAVILLGTNNVLRGESFDRVPADLDRILATSGVARERALIVQLPPTDPRPEQVGPFNRVLAEWARSRGVHLSSAAAHMDRGDGRFGPGMSYDGVHLVVDQARILGTSIGVQLLSMAGCGLPEFDARAAQAGNATGPVICGLRDGGCLQRRERGHLYRSSVTGAALVNDATMRAWGVSTAAET